MKEKSSERTGQTAILDKHKNLLELKIEEDRGKPVKRWIDVVEEDMKKRGVVQQDQGIGRVGGGEQ